MISICLPYWNRPAALADALQSYRRHYDCLAMEIVVADDGSSAAPDLAGEWPWPVRVIHLPPKDVALNPCVPMNEAVAASRGDVLVLSNAEIIHDQSVLPAMAAELRRLGPKGYVLAAAWCPDDGDWHCHSSIAGNGAGLVRQPPGSGFHFCAMLTRSLWDAAGGFDEDYRQGAGYDDPDWVNRLARAGAVFRIRDDLVVTHPRTAARSKWPAGAFERNRALFFSKWGA